MGIKLIFHLFMLSYCLPQVVWILNGKVVANDASHKILVNEKGDSSLMITAASVNDSGTLEVVARNKTGQATSQVRWTIYFSRNFSMQCRKRSDVTYVISLEIFLCNAQKKYNLYKK